MTSQKQIKGRHDQLQDMIKARQNKIVQLRNTIASKHQHIEKVENEILTLRQELIYLAQQLEDKPKCEPKLSDHALVRYLERKYNLDLETIKAEILTPDRREMIKQGCTKIKADGITFIVKDGTIVTSLN